MFIVLNANMQVMVLWDNWLSLEIDFMIFFHNSKSYSKNNILIREGEICVFLKKLILSFADWTTIRMLNDTDFDLRGWSIS